MRYLPRKLFGGFIAPNFVCESLRVAVALGDALAGPGAPIAGTAMASAGKRG